MKLLAFTPAILFLALLGSAARQPPSVAAEPATCPPLALCAPVRIVSVYDGDTATDVVIELHVQVRYLKCWAPELSQPGGKESRESAKLAEGKRGRLYIPLNQAGNIAALFTFGRVVGELWLDGATESESTRQVRTLHASTTKGGKLGE